MAGAGKKSKVQSGAKSSLAKSAKRSTASQSRIGHVLVVEDDAVLALAIEQTLEEAGASRVSICAAASEALDILRKTKPDVVVLDVHLADSNDGWEIAELLIAIGSRPPKIIFSTGSPQEIPADIAELGPVLEKPYDPKKLVALAGMPRRRGLMNLLRRSVAKARA